MQLRTGGGCWWSGGPLRMYVCMLPWLLRLALLIVSASDAVYKYVHCIEKGDARRDPASCNLVLSENKIKYPHISSGFASVHGVQCSVQVIVAVEVAL